VISPTPTAAQHEKARRIAAPHSKSPNDVSYFANALIGGDVSLSAGL